MFWAKKISFGRKKSNSLTLITQSLWFNKAIGTIWQIFSYLPDLFILFDQWVIYYIRMRNLVIFCANNLALIFLQEKVCIYRIKIFFYSIGIFRSCIYRKIPVNTGKICFIAFNLKTTGHCKFFLYLQDPVITEPCIFIALGSGRNLGRVFNFRRGHLQDAAFFVSPVKLPNLQLKTRPKQLLGYLSLVIVLPGYASSYVR